jgi:hypothetical protein
MKRDRNQLLLLRLCLVAAALGTLSCGSTELVHQWSNPAYVAPSFKKVMVIGVTRQAGMRRTFEDEFVAQLKAAGVNATPSYLYIPQDVPVGEAVLKQALKEAAADAMIITRLVRVQQKTEIAPGYYPPDCLERLLRAPDRLPVGGLYLRDQSIRYSQEPGRLERHSADHNPG